MMSFNLPSLKTDGERVLPLVMERSAGTWRVLDSFLAGKAQSWESVLVPVTGVNTFVGLFWFCCCCWEL